MVTRDSAIRFPEGSVTPHTRGARFTLANAATVSVSAPGATPAAKRAGHRWTFFSVSGSGLIVARAAGDSSVAVPSALPADNATPQDMEEGVRVLYVAANGPGAELVFDRPVSLCLLRNISGGALTLIAQVDVLAKA